MGLLSSSLIVSLLIAEMGLRLVAPQSPSWLDIYRALPDDRAYALQPNTRRDVVTGEGHWTVTTDEHGFRSSGTQHRPDDAPVALVLGDSFTFGQGVSDADTFVAQLGARADVPFRLHNSGVGGYGPVQYRLVLDDWISTQRAPHVAIIVIFTGNDFFDCIWDKRVPVRDGVLGDDGGWRSWLRRRLHMYRLVSRVWQQLTPAPANNPRRGISTSMQDPAAWERPPLLEAQAAFTTQIRHMAETGRLHGIQLMGVIIPSQDLVRQQDRQEPVAVSRAAAAFIEAKVEFLDSTDALRVLGAERAFLQRDGHLTPSGHAAVAALLAPHLQRLLVPSGPHAVPGSPSATPPSPNGR